MIPEIKLLTNPEEAKKVYEFLKQYPLEYPDYFIWLEKCLEQLKRGDKKAFYATDEKQIIGSIIFQKHKKEPNVLEVKNFRVAEEHRGKGIGSVLETMVHSFGKSKGFKRIQCDTHNNNFDMIGFLIRKDYVIEAEEPLYTPKQKEVILIKYL